MTLELAAARLLARSLGGAGGERGGFTCLRGLSEFDFPTWWLFMAVLWWSISNTTEPLGDGSLAFFFSFFSWSLAAGWLGGRVAS